MDPLEKVIRDAWARTKPFSALIRGGVFVLGAWVVLLAIAGFNALFDPKFLERLGQLGDAFGVLNALFTGLAILGAAYTICQQHQQIEQQKVDAARDAEARQQDIADGYLTARLNANVAMLQAIQANRESWGANPPKFEAARALRFSARIRREIGLLVYEATIHRGRVADRRARECLAVTLYTRTIISDIYNDIEYDYREFCYEYVAICMGMVNDLRFASEMYRRAIGRSPITEQIKEITDIMINNYLKVRNTFDNNVTRVNLESVPGKLRALLDLLDGKTSGPTPDTPKS